MAIRAAAFLIGAGCVVWATVPQVHKGLADWALFLATIGAAAGARRLARSPSEPRTPADQPPPLATPQRPAQGL